MTLARFYSRIHDAISPLLGADADLHGILASTTICLSGPPEIESDSAHRAGFLLLVNLCARLYPRIHIDVEEALRNECVSLALSINPHCEIASVVPSDPIWLAWGQSPSEGGVSVAPSGWTVFVNGPEAQRMAPANVLTSLAAAAIGAAEVFRLAFRAFLPEQRTRISRGSFNLLTSAEPNSSLPALPRQIDLGAVHLVGAGAVGQAAIYALARIPVTGTLFVIDSEEISLSNLQRYVLTGDKDVGARKVDLAARALSRSSLNVVAQPVVWGSTNQTSGMPLDTVCVAVDTAKTRIAIQAGIPRRIYNAWTQPADIGWSRHEQFGDLPCLACLYWPTHARPHLHELIAQSLREHPLRTLGYLTFNVPVGQPLHSQQIPNIADLAKPPESSEWHERALLADVASTFGLTPEAAAQWSDRQLGDLYRDGICGGAILRAHPDTPEPDVAVPLAHQSVLAGIMLAVQLVVAQAPELVGWRPASIEGRIDLLSPLPQIVVRPREKATNCICSDFDYRYAWTSTWLSRAQS